jgi:nicotinamide-nucleotide amidase
MASSRRIGEALKVQEPDREQAEMDRSLVDRASQVAKHLQAERLTVVTAESCTAGLISAVLSEADGASEILHGSFVTYTKANKIKALGVDKALLEGQGSVNAEVIRQLIAGALERSPADVALAVSGVLGPSPDEDGNPVGLVYLGCGLRGQPPSIVRKCYPDLPHEILRRKAVMDALELLDTSLRQ